MSKVTILFRTSTLGYHPGQIVILDDNPMIRGIIKSGHAELVWEDVSGSPESSVDSAERPETSGSVGGNGIKSESGERSTGSKKTSSTRRRDPEPIPQPWQSGQFFTEDLAANYEGRETD